MRNNKGQFSEGNPGKPVGASSKETKAIRQRFKKLLDDNLDTLQSDLDQLKPADRINAILSLANYVVPKLKSADLTFNAEVENKFKPIQIIIENENR